MNAIHELLNRRWIIREKDKELYYKLKDASGEYRKFLNEKLGYQLVITPHLIKVVKMPGYAEPWMGIQDFNEVIEYQMLCWILIYLEDKEPDEQFLLSQLCEFLQMQTTTDILDWTKTKQRRSLVNVIRFCQQQCIFEIYDGDEEGFGRNQDNEVLFGNLGNSKYFMRTFTQDIMTYQTPQDFERSDWINADESRGIVRRNRVYRRLAMSMGVYREVGEDADFDYIKNQRSVIEHDFQKYVNCHLDIHRSSAYLIIDNDEIFGRTFPANNSESDLMLLWNDVMQKQIQNAKERLCQNETILFSHEELDVSMEEVRQQHGNYFAKKYRDMTTQEFIRSLRKSLLTYGWIKYDNLTNRYIIYPIVGKIKGTMIEREAAA